MAIAPDGTTLIVGEASGARLSAFAIAPDGSLGSRRPWADVGEVSADGICLDDQGAVRAASPATDTVLRVAEGGEVLATLTTRAPPTRAYSPDPAHGAERTAGQRRLVPR